MDEKKYNYIKKSFTFNGERYFVYGKTEKEANAKLIEKKSELLSGAVTSGITVGEWSDKWLNTYIKPRVRKSGADKASGTLTQKSFGMYTEKLNGYILPSIRNMKMSDVKDYHLMDILNSQAGRSKSHLSKLRIVIRALFSQAFVSGIIPKDPSAKLVIPAYSVGERRSITDYERKIFLEVCETHRCGLMFEYMLGTGVRPCEVVAIQAGDFDFDRCITHITKSVESGTNIVGMPKTDAGIRDVPIPKHLVKPLKELCSKKEPSDFVFTQTDGKSMKTSTCLKNDWRAFTRQMDLAMGAETTSHGHIYDPRDLKADGTPLCPDENGNPKNGHKLADDFLMYNLRHTFCTDMQKAGVPINIAKVIMGHSDISVTANIYTHSGEEEVKMVGNLMDSYNASKKET